MHTLNQQIIRLSTLNDSQKLEKGSCISKFPYRYMPMFTVKPSYIVLYLNRFEGVAENTLLPSGDHLNVETPPPPNLLSGVLISVAMSQANIVVSTADEDMSRRPSGLHVRLVTGQCPLCCNTCTELDDGLKKMKQILTKT